jgi:hypothetical protein
MTEVSHTARMKRLEATLRARFPAAFPQEPGLLCPLKIGIREDLLAALTGETDHRLLPPLLAKHTGRIAYLRALVRASHRIDLKGQPVQPVDEHSRALSAPVMIVEERIAGEQIGNHRDIHGIERFAARRTDPAQHMGIQAGAFNSLGFFLDDVFALIPHALRDWPQAGQGFSSNSSTGSRAISPKRSAFISYLEHRVRL